MLPKPKQIDNIARIIARIFEEELGKSNVPVNQNFFDIGATSVALTKIHAEIHSQLGVELDLVELYSSPTILDLATLLESRCGDTARGPTGRTAGR